MAVTNQPIGKCPGCGTAGEIEAGCPTCPGFWYEATPAECEGCPGTDTPATRIYRDEDDALVHYCADCGDLAECGWNGNLYVRVDETVDGKKRA